MIKIKTPLMGLWTGIVAVTFLSAQGDAAAAATPSTATHARIELRTDSSTGKLKNLCATKGDVKVYGQPIAQANGSAWTYSVEPTVVGFTWLETVLQFTPEHDGQVTLALRGPWERARGTDKPYKSEILWRNISATGTTITNGNFTEWNGGIPVGWKRPYGDATGFESADDPGKRVPRTWHDAPLEATFEVTKDKPVILRFSSKAFLPENAPTMVRLTNLQSPAHQAIKRFRRGVNYGNYLEGGPGSYLRPRYTAEDFKNTKKEGFDHVRLPIGWHHYTGPAPDFKILPEVFNVVDTMVSFAISNDLSIILNIQHFDRFTDDPLARSNEFCVIWRQIATHYAKSPSNVALELINEPKDAATTAVINPIYAAAFREIRKVDPKRTIFVGPGQWNQVDELSRLILPPEDDNLIVTIHCYDPFFFTHQGASWAGNDPKTTGIKFPGPPDQPVVPAAGISSTTSNWIADYNTLPTPCNPCSPKAFRAKLEIAKAWGDYYGRPIHLGEFGAYIKADHDSRIRFYTEMRKAAEEMGFAWGIWDWHAGFQYWDEKANAPVPGMREALFGKR